MKTVIVCSVDSIDLKKLGKQRRSQLVIPGTYAVDNNVAQLCGLILFESCLNEY
jgi:hypothetical protein